MNAQRYGLTVARSAATAAAEHLPESVASAVIELIAGPLVDAPRRVGTPLHRDLDRVGRRGVARFESRSEPTSSSAKSWCCVWFTFDTPTDPWVIPSRSRWQRTTGSQPTINRRRRPIQMASSQGCVALCKDTRISYNQRERRCRCSDERVSWFCHEAGHP